MTEQATETPTVDLTQSADPFLSVIMPGVLGEIEGMKGIAESLRKHSPPSLVDVDKYIRENPDGNDSITMGNKAIEDLEEKLKLTRKKLRDFAGAALTPEPLPDADLSALRAKFAAARDSVQVKINSAKTYTTTMRLDDETAALEALKIPQFRSGPTAGEDVSKAQQVREWAKTSWPGEQPAPKGRIPQAIQEAYDAAQGQPGATSANGADPATPTAPAAPAVTF